MSPPRRRQPLRLPWSEDDSWSSSASYGGGGDEETEVGLLGLMGRDLTLAFLWVWTSTVVNLTLGESGLFRAFIFILIKLLFAWLEIVTGGGLHNPLPTFASSVSGGPVGFFPTILGRIPAQIAGYIIGVTMIARIIPEYYGGPELKVSIIHVGALTEGILAFIIVTIGLLLKETGAGLLPQSIISSIFKLILRNFGSSFTGGWMNPGSAFGWAYAKGIHMSVEHWLVYWILPFQAIMFAVWAFNSVVHPEINREALDNAVARWKSD